MTATVQRLVLVTQSYLHYATVPQLERAAEQAEISVVLNDSDVLHPKLEPFVSRVHRVESDTRATLQASFSVDGLTAVVEAEIAAAGGDPRRVALFCQHEDNVLPVAHTRARLGIDGHGPELVGPFRDKIAMKRAVARALPDAPPRYQLFDLARAERDVVAYHAQLVAELGSATLIVKPTSGAGSLNVTPVHEPDDLAAAVAMIREDSHDFAYEVDEFLDGQMYQCDSLVRHGKVVFSGILELGCSNFDMVKGQPLSVFPVGDSELYAQLFDYNQSVVSALGLRDGSTHNELFLSPTGDGRYTPRFVEIAARVPGGLGVPFHEANSGINLMDANLMIALGDDARVDGLRPTHRNNVVSALLPVGHGRIKARNEPDVRSPYRIDWSVQVGDVVNSRSLVDNAGVLTLVNDDLAVLRRDFESLSTYVPVTCT